jgi:hypothetical protein
MADDTWNRIEASGKWMPPVAEDFAPRIEMDVSADGLAITGYCTDKQGKPEQMTVVCKTLEDAPKYLLGLKRNLWWVMHVENGIEDLPRV